MFLKAKGKEQHLCLKLNVNKSQVAQIPVNNCFIIPFTLDEVKFQVTTSNQPFLSHSTSSISVLQITKEYCLYWISLNDLTIYRLSQQTGQHRFLLRRLTKRSFCLTLCWEEQKKSISKVITNSNVAFFSHEQSQKKFSSLKYKIDIYYSLLLYQNALTLILNGIFLILRIFKQIGPFRS